MGEVATIPPTIQIIVVDEKGTKANCKLFITEKLSEILKKYNSKLHTSYDSIMINNAPVQLHQTPALLGLEDGQVLQFCKTSIFSQLAPHGTKDDGVSGETVAKMERRVAMLEMELETANQKYQFLQTKIVNLENKLTEEQEKTQCRICFDRYRDTLIFPCLHFSYCSVCLEDLRGRECPSCRGHISGTLRMQIG